MNTENKLDVFMNPNSELSKKEQKIDDNPLLKSIDRAVFTFSMHNLGELCFNHVFKVSDSPKEFSNVSC